MTRWDPETPRERFDRYAKPAPNGCIIWTGKRDRQGYGRLFITVDHSELAHRFAYMTFVGPIPADLHIHHECHTRSCVNPEHLTLVDPSAHVALHRRDKCIHGHEFTPENTRTIKGKRHCRKCDARRQREYRARLAVAA